MRYIIQTFAFLTLFSLIGCGGSEPKSAEGDVEASTTSAAGEIDYDAMAVELCECMTPMMDLQSKLMNLLATGDEEGIQSMEAEAMKVQQDGEACVQAMEEKFGVIEGAEAEEKATEALRKACPDFMAMMEGATGPGGGMGEMSEEELEKVLKEMEAESGN